MYQVKRSAGAVQSGIAHVSLNVYFQPVITLRVLVF